MSSTGRLSDGCQAYVAQNARRLAEEAFGDMAERLGKAKDEAICLRLRLGAMAAPSATVEALDVRDARIAALEQALECERAEVQELAAELSKRADWRPRREMPEGWSVSPSTMVGYLVASNGTDVRAVEIRVAIALAAYLDAEGV